jgi:RNA polymerase sigma-70 factor, ECF subfamily
VEQTGIPSDLLQRAGAGSREALEQVFPFLYDELRLLARRQLAKESAGHTLATTELVHEAYLRLVDQTRVEWSGRAHLLGVAATAMRRILVDHARTRLRRKRGGGLRPVPLESVDLATAERAELVIALDDALERLKELNERQARVVEFRFFGGLTEEETAAALGIALRTVRRDWAKARSWLYRELYGT